MISGKKILLLLSFALLSQQIYNQQISNKPYSDSTIDTKEEDFNKIMVPTPDMPSTKEKITALSANLGSIILLPCPLDELSSSMQQLKLGSTQVPEKQTLLLRDFFDDGENREFYVTLGDDIKSTPTIVSLEDSYRSASDVFFSGINQKNEAHILKGITHLPRNWNKLSRQEQINMLKKENYAVNHLQAPYIKFLLSTAATTGFLWGGKLLFTQLKLTPILNKYSVGAMAVASLYITFNTVGKKVTRFAASRGLGKGIETTVNNAVDQMTTD